MARGIRKQEGEDLSDSNILRVIEALNREVPVSKKAACEMLAINYNTTRLNKIIASYEEKMEFRKIMRKQMRGMPIDTATASEIVSSYLSEISLSDISASTHRSTAVVKRVLTKYNIPIKNASVDYWNPPLINDDAITDDYKKGDLVYSARYNTPATIVSSKLTDKHGMVYDLQIHGNTRRRVTQPYYELADLRRVQTELDIKMHDLTQDEVRALINEGLRNQKKQEDNRK